MKLIQGVWRESQQFADLCQIAQQFGRVGFVCWPHVLNVFQNISFERKGLRGSARATCGHNRRGVFGYWTVAGACGLTLLLHVLHG